MRPVPIGIALLIAVSAPASAADAIAAIDEYNIRSAIILKCHPGHDAADLAYLARGDALRRAAIEQIRGQLDAADPAHRNDNGKKAADMVQLRRAARDYDIDEQIRNYGCGWLDSSRRESLF